MVASVRDSRARSILQPEQVKTALKAVVATVTLPADRFGADTRLVLREFDIALPRCKDLVSGEHPNGFGLTLERKGRPTIHLSRDQTIPVCARLPGDLRHRGGACAAPARRLDRTGRVDPLFLHGIRRTGPTLHRGDGPGP